MDNYKLYANLIRKPDPSDFNARPCVVEKWIPISHWSFEQIKQDPLHDLEAVKAYNKSTTDLLIFLKKGKISLPKLLRAGQLRAVFFHSTKKPQDRFDLAVLAFLFLF